MMLLNRRAKMHWPFSRQPCEQSFGFEALDGFEHGGPTQRALLLDRVGDLPFGARLLLPHQPEYAHFQLAERRKFLGHAGPFELTSFLTAAAVSAHFYDRCRHMSRIIPRGYNGD